MSLYNCKSDGDHYRITKFTNDLEVEASYLTDGAECDCPAGHRPVCRHRIMLPRFIVKSATSGQWFHNYEHEQWARAAADDAIITERDEHQAGVAIAGEKFDGVYEDVPYRLVEELPRPINLLALAESQPQPIEDKPLRRL